MVTFLLKCGSQRSQWTIIGLSVKSFLPAATARWSISAVFPSSPTSGHKTIEHGSIETNELNITLMSHMIHHESVCLI